MSSKKKVGKKILEKNRKKNLKDSSKNKISVKIPVKNTGSKDKKKYIIIKAKDKTTHKPIKPVKSLKKSEKKKTPEIPKTIILEDVKVEEIPIITSVVEETILEEKIVGPVIEETIEPVIEEPIEKKKQVSKIPNEDYQEDKNKVEALLFACGKYIEEQTISELCSIDKRKLRKILEELHKDYESKNNALMIFNEGTSWKINVREKYLSTVRKIVADTELPKSVMETLAVIAWKTPINQSEVVKIRGNKCYDHIEVLEVAGFVSKEKKGRSFVLKATEKFFKYFEIDHGNLKGIFDTVKVSEVKEEQKTLEQTAIINKDEIDKIAAIEVRKWTETEEEKRGHKQFLEQIENKIKEAKEKNELLAQEIPRPVLKKPIEETIQLTENQSETPNVDGNIASEVNNALPIKNVEQPIENIPAKPKSLTKKQLEKKFRDELLRVREKMEKKESHKK